MNDIIKKIEAEQLKENAPEFNVGDTVKVYAKIKEGNRERIQVFEGTVLKRQVVVVAVELLSDVPAESHLQGAVAEQSDLVAAGDGSVEVDAVGVVQGLDGLDVLGRVCSVLGVSVVGEGADRPVRP